MIFCLNNDEHSFHDNIGTVPNNIESSVKWVSLDLQTSQLHIILNEYAFCFDNTSLNIRIYCHKRKVNSIDAKINTNNYDLFILPADEQTYSVTLIKNTRINQEMKIRGDGLNQHLTKYLLRTLFFYNLL